jgi:integrase
MGKLTARGVQTAGPGKHEDGEGLRLVVSPTGARKWVLRVTVDGKRREMGLGSFPEVTLADARTKASDARRKAQAGTDPIQARTLEAAQTARQAAGVPTFAEAAASYIQAHAPGWSNAKHAAQWSATLATYAAPVIGTKPIDQIGTEDVLKLLSGIWTTKTETAKRVQGRVENIMDWATARKYRTGENPARWRGHLDKLLPKPAKVTKPVHHPAMPYADVPAFMAELTDRSCVSALALRFLILTACRTGEVIGARWDEIDLEAAVWTIPAARMKAGQLHRVPLSSAGLAVLQALPRIEGNPYCFPGARHGKPLSNMALLQLMRGMGYGVTGERGAFVPHGFRSAFRDWSGEVSSFPRDVCEMALAHVIENKVEAAYRRGDLFAKRASMMDEWASWCCRQTPAVRAIVREATG